MKPNKKIKLLKEVIKIVKKEYGVKMCKHYAPGCFNCGAQMLIGLLDNYVSDIQFDIQCGTAFDKVAEKI